MIVNADPKHWFKLAFQLEFQPLKVQRDQQQQQPACSANNFPIMLTYDIFVFFSNGFNSLMRARPFVFCHFKEFISVAFDS